MECVCDVATMAVGANSMSPLIYQFTPDEQRFIKEAYQTYLNRLQFIIDCHQLKGQLAPSQDGQGIVDMTTPIVKE